MLITFCTFFSLRFITAIVIFIFLHSEFISVATTINFSRLFNHVAMYLYQPSVSFQFHYTSSLLYHHFPARDRRTKLLPWFSPVHIFLLILVLRFLYLFNATFTFLSLSVLSPFPLYSNSHCCTTRPTPPKNLSETAAVSCLSGVFFSSSTLHWTCSFQIKTIQSDMNGED